MIRGMYRNGTYQIEASRERLRRFFAVGVVLVSPELRRRRLEFHSKLVESGWLFASGPNDMAPNAQAGFLTVNSKHCALRPINGR